MHKIFTNSFFGDLMGHNKFKISAFDVLLIILFGIALGMIITIILPFWFWILIASICIFISVWYFWKNI